MKIFKYAIAIVALLAMAVSFNSCSKDVDPDVDAKDYFLFDFGFSNKGSLTEAEVATGDSLISAVIYGGSSDRYPMYCTYDYAMNNFNTIKSKGTSSDVQTKIVDVLAKKTGKYDFTLTLAVKRCTYEYDKNYVPTYTPVESIAQTSWNPVK